MTHGTKYLRIQAKKGTNIASFCPRKKGAMRTASSLLTVQEMYQEEEKDRDAKVEDISIPRQRISLGDMIRHVTRAGYEDSIQCCRLYRDFIGHRLSQKAALNRAPLAGFSE